MQINKLMEPHWQTVGDWKSLKLSKEANEILDLQIADVNDEEDCHIHLRDLEIEKDYLNYAMRIAASLFEKYSQTKRSAPLVIFISLDDGSGLDDFEPEEDNPWLDCTLHFHIEHPDFPVFMNPSTIDECVQPVLVIDSNDQLFSKNLARD